MDTKQQNPVRKLIHLPQELVDQINDFRFERRIQSEAEAIRQLIRAGLEAQREQSP